MWPFDEEEQQDSTLAEFDSVSKYIYEQAETPDEALGALRDVYSEYEFQDRKKAEDILASRSREVRERFDVKTPFDYNATIDAAPINFDEIEVEGETEEQQKLDRINKWELKNKEALAATEEPEYIQNRDWLTGNIEKAAVLQRREVLGKANYIEDRTLRFFQGAISPFAHALGDKDLENYFIERTNPEYDESYGSAIASGLGSAAGAVGSALAAGPVGAYGYLGLQGVGAAKEQYEEARQVGATQGEALAAAGIEAASQTVQATVGGKIFGKVAGQLGGEAVDQTIQKLGTKVFPRVLGAATLEGTTESAGQVASNYAESIGQDTEFDPTKGTATSFIAGFVTAGLASGIGEVAQSVRGTESTLPPTTSPVEGEVQNVVIPEEGEQATVEPQLQDTGFLAKEGTGRLDYSTVGEDSVYISNLQVNPERQGRGEGTALVTDLIFRAKADGKNKIFVVPTADTEALQPRLEAFYENLGFEFTGEAKEMVLDIDKHFPDLVVKQAEQQAEELNNAIEQENLQTTPPSEVLVKKSRPVTLANPDVVATREDGTKIVTDGDRLHNDDNLGNGTVEEAYQHTFSVQPDVANRLQQLKAAAAPDGTSFHIYSRDGKLFVKSKFLKPDFLTNPDPISDKPTGLQEVEVPAVSGLEVGQVDVQVDGVDIETVDAHQKISVVTGKEARIGSSPIAGKSAGAAFVGDMKGKKEQQWAKRFRNTLTPEQAEAFGLSLQGEDSEGTAIQYPLMTYVPNVNKQQGIEAATFIKDKGYIGTLAYLETLEGKGGPQDYAVASVLTAQLKRAQEQAAADGNFKLEDAYVPLIQNAARIQAGLSNAAGSTMQLGTNQAQRAMGGIVIPEEVQEAIGVFRRDARQKAEEDTAKELGLPKVGLKELQIEAEAADAEVAAIEAEIGDPVAKELAAMDAEIQEIKDKEQRKNIDEPLQQMEEELVELKRQEAEALEDVKNQLTETGVAVQQEIQIVEGELAEVSADISTPVMLEPTKAQLDRKAELENRIKELETQREKLTASIEATKPTESAPTEKPKSVISIKGESVNEELELKDTPDGGISAGNFKAKDLPSLIRQINKSLKDNKAFGYFGDKKYKGATAQIKVVKPTESAPTTDKKVLKQQEQTAKKVVELQNKLEAVTNKLTETETKLANVENSIEERKATPKKPLSEAVKRQNELRKKLTSLRHQFEQERKLDPKNSKKVKHLRSLAAERQNMIRSLKKAKKAPLALSDKAQKKVDAIEAKKTTLSTAAKEGRIKISIPKETTTKLVNAKTRQRKARTAFDMAKAKFEENMSKFSIKDQQLLAELYRAREEAISPTDRAVLDQAILAQLIKILPPTSESISKITEYWRANQLSGPETWLRNMGSFLSVVGTASSYAATDVGRLATGQRTKSIEFVKGVTTGLLNAAFNDAVDVMQGARRGRLSTNPEGDMNAPAPELRWLTSKVGNFTIVNPVQPLLAIAELSRRVQAATDTVAFGTANEGHARVAALLAAGKGTKEQQLSLMQNMLYETDTRIKQNRAAVAARVQALKAVGIEMTPRQQRIMFYELMESSRPERVREASKAGGLRAVYMNPPEGIMGATVKLMQGVTNAVFEIGGKRVKFVPQILNSFLNVAGNLTNEMMSYMPITAPGGIVRAKRKSQEARAAAVLKATKESENNVAQGLAALTEAEIQQRADEADIYHQEFLEYSGRMMVGTVVMVGMASILAAFDDDKNPFIKFYGAIPEGKEDEWKAQGIKPFTLKIGGMTLSRDLLGPLTYALAGADIINRSVKANQPIERTAFMLVTALGNALGSISFMKNSSEFFNALSGGKALDEDLTMSERAATRTSNWLSSWAAGNIQGFVPSVGFLRNLYKWTDGTPTQTYNNFKAKLLNNIPYGREISGAKRMLNAFGEPIELPWQQRVPTNIFVTTRNDDPINQWRVRTGYTFTPPTPTIKMGKRETLAYGEDRVAKLGEGYRDLLDENESYEVLRISGPQIKEFLSSLINEPDFSTFSEENQAYINKQVAAIRAEARLEVLDRSVR